YDLNSYNSRKSFSLQTSPRFQNDRTWNLKLDVKRDFGEFRFPFDLRAGASLYQLHRRKQAGQIVLNYVGPDGIANNADDPQLNAAQFIKTTYGDKFLYGIRTPPLVDPYKFADFMRANPNSVQDFQATYRWTPNLLFRGAVTRSMSRPGVQTILPNTTVNDTAAIPNVSVNNTALKPTYSRNIDLEVELYTKSAGVITAGYFKKTVT